MKDSLPYMICDRAMLFRMIGSIPYGVLPIDHIIFVVLPTLAWVKSAWSPLLCKEGGGEVEAWSGNTWVPPCNLRPMARLYPTLILPLQRGGSLPNGILEKAR